MTQIALNLPDQIAKDAESNGLLKPEVLASILRAEIQRRKVNKLFSTADNLAEVGEPLSDKEVEAEITASRKERRNSYARGS